MTTVITVPLFFGYESISFNYTLKSDSYIIFVINDFYKEMAFSLNVPYTKHNKSTTKPWPILLVFYSIVTYKKPQNSGAYWG